MPATTVPFGDPKAQKKWSGKLFLDTLHKSYWDRKFVGEGENYCIQRLTDLESAAGDTIDYDLSVQLRGRPVSGDNRLEGREEALRFYSDEVKIDQLRHGVSAGGKMSRKRTALNLRNIGRERLSDYWAKYLDEMHFIYMSGGRGINEDFYEPTTYAGHATNSIQAPDSAHIIYASTATQKSEITSSMKMSRTLIERCQTKAKMLRALDPTKANMQPLMINGEMHYVLLMNPFQAYDLRVADTTGWVEMQKAAAAAEGRNNPIFKGGLGMLGRTVLHEHESSIRFSDYGSGANLPAGRALFLGKQAGVIAYGSTGKGRRFSWSEKLVDHDNEPVIAAGLIVGIKKSRFNSSDFGVFSVDTYAANPN